MLEELSRVLSNLSPDEIKAFLGQLLTEKEKERLERRWKIVLMLHQGVSQRTIAAQLSLGLCNITRGAKEMKAPGSIVTNILDRGYHLDPSDTAPRKPKK
jgi:Trp operon repressor